MVEITSEEQNKVKRMKRTEDSLSDLLGQYQTHQHSNYRGPRRRAKERVWEHFWRDYSWKFPQHGKGNNQSSPSGTKSPIQDKPKEKPAKTHTNQTTNDYTQRKTIESSKGEATSNVQVKPHTLNSWSFSRNCWPEGNGTIYLKFSSVQSLSHV